MPTVDAPPPTDLPVEAVVDEVREALSGFGAAVLVAPPGAGKTTLVPLRLLQEPWLAGQRIVVLEPRKLAARAAARRMASLLGERAGETVGYRTRDERVVGRTTRIEVITEGILVRWLQGDPSLDGTGLVVLDEVHERNLTTDLSLALVADARSGLRPDLRVLAMSATVDAEPFAAVLGGGGGGGAAGGAGAAPVVSSEGRSHEVQIEHLPPGPRDRLDTQVARAVGTAVRAVAVGDVLVFLPGAADIRRAAERLTAPGALPDSIDVRPLFGALASTEQDLALEPSPPRRRRVVLATDIAESSLTVAGVRIVVDAGLVRVPRLDPTTGMARLSTEPASLASADQRAGRAGRLGPGVAYRLWDRTDAARRPRFPVPEIAVADLAPLVLEIAVWGTTPDRLPLLDQPPAAAASAARGVLRGLGALDDDGRATALGRAMAELPVHPRLAALVLRGVELGAGWTAAVLATVLEEPDTVRGRVEDPPVDLALRLDRLDRSARRRAEQVARRLGVAPGKIDAGVVGELVAEAYPERIAQARGGGGFRLRGGGGGSLDAGDPLAREPFLAVAQLRDGPRGPMVALAAALETADVARLVGSDTEERVELTWDGERNDLRERSEVRSGALVLSSADGPARPGPATVAALVERVRATDGAALRWTPAARSLQGRLAFLHGLEPGTWPDVSDAALLARLDEWLAPLLPGASGRRDLEGVDLLVALRTGLSHEQVRQLDALAPTSFRGAGGRTIPISYDRAAGGDGQPRASARVQHLFGLATHPTVGGGRVPVVLELLSPASRPVQVTADLPGFWAGSWAVVRKEMAGRYPKHAWPADPSRA